MINPANHITQIFVEEDCQDLPYTQKILNRANNIPVEVIKGHQLQSRYEAPYPDSLHKGKKDLFLCKNRGHFFKPCPGTKEYRCCEYQVLNIGMNCPMDCVYCILQAYLNNPWLSFFVNINDLITELEQAFTAEPNRFFRIGTGEFTDSLALDQLTGLSTILIDFMSSKSNAVLELKTKSAMIENLSDVEHGGRTVISWSLNSPVIMQQEELRAATLEERLEAAAQCAAWGYKLAFHFDPIIFHPDWQKNYSYTIDQLFNKVPAGKIAWISMGALRFLPNLKNIAASRFHQSRFFFEEFITGLDNKSRYFRPQRVEMYSHIYSQLKERAAEQTCIYLCMESDEIWQEVFDFIPSDHGGLPEMLDNAVTAPPLDESTPNDSVTK